jgi:hypothetical protein
MRACGEPVGGVFAVSLPGLKTRYEELLVDRSRAALEARMREFFESCSLDEFASRHRLPERTRPKLVAAFEARARTRFNQDALRPFARYAGRPHRFRVPARAMLWAYVDRELIPRGDHRFRGSWDPHQRGPKLVFNVREVPLAAAVVEGGACVHDYQHARFAPLWVPGRMVREGLSASWGKSDTRALGAEELNLTPAWAEAAARLRAPDDLLHYIAAIFNSRLVQERFAPMVGATEEVPIARVSATSLPLVQQLADTARALGPGEDLPATSEVLVRCLYGLS